jgi:hypothetical protein
MDKSAVGDVEAQFLFANLRDTKHSKLIPIILSKVPPRATEDVNLSQTRGRQVQGREPSTTGPLRPGANINRLIVIGR